MINLRTEDAVDLLILRTFADGDWRKGLALLAAREKSKAIKEVMRAQPTAAGDIARAQAGYLVWDLDIPCIADCVDKFLAEEAAAIRGS